MELQDALAQAKLSQFYEQFKDAGCEEIADVAGMDDAAILALGLKDVQLKRLRRTFEKQGGAKAAEAIPVAYAAPAQMSPQALANQQAMMNERTAPSAQQAALNQQLLLPQQNLSQQVTVVAPTMAFQQPPGCCCKFWCPCLAVCCHEGCTCNLCGALCFGCLFTSCCWTPQTIPVGVTDMER